MSRAQPLMGSGPNQIANPLLPYGLRTVDGTENNLVEGQNDFGSASRVFPRLSDPEWRTLGRRPELRVGEFQRHGQQPAFRQQRDRGPDGHQPGRRRRCRPGAPHGERQPNSCALRWCRACRKTACLRVRLLDIPNVTTDFGLSPPYNGMFALFGQFFDHGVDFTKKTKNYVMMPLAEDDPLYVPGGRTNFMLLSRAENQAGPDGISATRTISRTPPTPIRPGWTRARPTRPTRRTRCSCVNTPWTRTTGRLPPAS